VQIGCSCKLQVTVAVQVGVIVLLDLLVLGYEQLQYMQGKTPFQ
jgi:hypothetical protein